MLVSASLASGWIAVVDDDVSLREAISSLLRAHSLHARTFGSAEAFLPALVTGMPSCVIFDMHMPGRTGLELLQHLRANGFQIPAIIITAGANPRLREHCEAAGASAFLTKPLDTDLLLSAIEQATSSARESI
ncbi:MULTISPECIES: response regulator transcription factor [Bradyrhizobium]|jgi:FixJ family two-component response regulator|nr:MULTISPECIES: response regulator [Bradyrhizobium]QOZ15040.1 response regulator [Bradyrhizobium sp. CCBAU 21365]BBC02977.1 two-component response regulator [Bradyrhizobium elkanii USDA 61]